MRQIFDWKVRGNIATWCMKSIYVSDTSSIDWQIQAATESVPFSLPSECDTQFSKVASGRLVRVCGWVRQEIVRNLKALRRYLIS